MRFVLVAILAMVAPISFAQQGGTLAKVQGGIPFIVYEVENPASPATDPLLFSEPTFMRARPDLIKRTKKTRKIVDDKTFIQTANEIRINACLAVGKGRITLSLDVDLSAKVLDVGVSPGGGLMVEFECEGGKAI
jgi:hypothetical protein